MSAIAIKRGAACAALALVVVALPPASQAAQRITYEAEHYLFEDPPTAKAAEPLRPTLWTLASLTEGTPLSEEIRAADQAISAQDEGPTIRSNPEASGGTVVQFWQSGDWVEFAWPGMPATILSVRFASQNWCAQIVFTFHNGLTTLGTAESAEKCPKNGTADLVLRRVDAVIPPGTTFITATFDTSIDPFDAGWGNGAMDYFVVEIPV